MRRFKIRTTLAAAFAFIFLLSFVSISIATIRLKNVANATGEMMKIPLAKERLANEWYGNIQSAIPRTIAIAKSADPSLAVFFAADAAASSKRSGDLQKAMGDLLFTEAERTLYKIIGEKRKIYLSSRETLLALKKAGKSVDANKILEQTFIPDSKEYLHALHDLVLLQQSNIDNTAMDIENTYSKSLSQTLVLAFASLIAGAFCAIGLGRILRRQLGGEPAYAKSITNEISQNNLAVEVSLHPKDTRSLLFSIKTMRDNLAKIVLNVREGTDRITNAAGEIAAGSLDLSSRTEEQAASLEQASASLAQLSVTVKQNAENAAEASDKAVMAGEIARKGGEDISQAAEKMEAINSSAKKIADIISVIDGIAFQTNILALNAAVEAARAGDQGRGFAVVAAEVRNLAQRSATASKEIKSLIMDSLDRTAEGAIMVNQAQATMKQILLSVGDVSDMFKEIATSSREQSEGIDQISSAVTQMDTVTQQNSALVEEASAVAESLKIESAELALLVGRFKL